MLQTAFRSLSRFAVAASALLFCGSTVAEEFKDPIHGRVERFMPNGNFVFKQSIDGLSTVIVGAPGGSVSIDGGIDGGSKVMLEAKRIVIGHIDGDSIVLATLSKGGELQLVGTAGSAKVFWCKADDGDPQPTIKQGRVVDSVIKQVTRQEMDKLIEEYKKIEAPTADRFYLRVETLVDGVADLEIRRFTVLAPAGKTFKFHIGKAGIGSKGHRTAIDHANVRRLEAIVILRLHCADAPQNTKIRRLMKFHRTNGNTAESEFDAAGRESLAGVVEIKAKSDHYPLGKPVTVGTVNGENLVVTVE